MPAGMTPLHRAQLLSERIHGIAERRPAAAAARATPVLAQVVRLPRRPAPLPGEAHVVRLDAKGRFVLAGVRARLGWMPGDLHPVSGHDDWIVLRAAGTTSTARGTARLSAAERVSLPRALRHRVRLDAGDQAFVLEMPRAGYLAVTHPAYVVPVPLMLADTELSR